MTLLTPEVELVPATVPALNKLPFSLFARLIVLAALFALELTGISVWLDNDSIAGSAGLLRFAHDWGPWILRLIVGSAAIFATFAFLGSGPVLKEVSLRVSHTAVSRNLLVLHLALLAGFGGVSQLLYTKRLAGSSADAVAALWIALGVASIGLAACAFVPGSAWRRVVSGTGHLWLYSFAAVLCACLAGPSIRSLWAPTGRLTFAIVQTLLTPVLPGIVADPTTMSIGTARFTVEIAPECSGLEGIGLILAFTAAWLVLLRKECRFPHALFLLPAGVAFMFCLNAVRIATLILIGNAGAERIAVGGFHSQAGWIIFNLVALLLAAGARRIPWVMRSAPAVAPVRARTQNPEAAYLVPFIAILATGMLATALSAGFEWLYPLRFFAAAAVIWHFRKQYGRALGGMTWAGPVLGAAVFLIWVLLERSAAPVSDAMPAALAAASPPVRILWILFRALAATLTVPIAEELAFRGFLLRRLVSPDFEAVSFRTFTWVAVIVSSVLFGLLHGDRWLAGTLAGLFYAWAAIRRGKLADAIAAHATTNGLLAIAVLAAGKWHYW